MPTIYHWAHAASPGKFTDIAHLSNFGGELAAVGQYLGIGVHGLYDAAGNVREWCYNAIGNRDDAYCISGGAWGEHTYMAMSRLLRSAWDRDQANGVRCMRYLDRDQVPDKAFADMECKSRHLSDFQPVSDEIFQSYVDTLYDYDDTPLEAVVESELHDIPYCRSEKISFNAAYPGERVTAYLNLPIGVSPPYQTVVWFPGGGARSQPWRYQRLRKDHLACILQSGRAVVVPVYKGTFERRLEKERYDPAGIQSRNLYVQRSQDLRRTIDYLQTRSDIDAQRLAYAGLSWGALIGPVMMAVEERLCGGILLSRGLCPCDRHPSSDPANFAPRVTVPVLMINGREDAEFPYETDQKPFFYLLGTSLPHKKHVVYPGGHAIAWEYREQYHQEIRDWLDHTLGPVPFSAPLAKETQHE